MRILLRTISMVIVLSCVGCCNEELIDTYLLSEYEKSLIPFTDFEDLNYIDENGTRLKASTQPRIIEVNKVNRGPESCEYWEVENLSNFINYSEAGFSIQLDLEKFNDRTYFSLQYVIPDSDNSENQYFDDILNPNNDQVVNINLHGFEFENVYVFNNNYLNEDSDIELILYSSEGKGVRLISFIDGKFLRLE